MNIKGTHETMGLILQTNGDFGNGLQLKECKRSTPAAKIPKWKSTLRESFLIKINDTKMNSIR